MDIDFSKLKNELYKGSTKHLSFDLTKVEKNVYSEFGVENGEMIKAHIAKKKMGIFTQEVLVITNCAIYTLKKLTKNLNSNRIELDKLCDYVSTADHFKYSCVLINEDGEFPLLDKSLGDIFLNRTYGEELNLFIQTLQMYVMDKDSLYLEKRKKVISWAISEANKALAEGDILNNRLLVVKELQKEPSCYVQMSILIGKNLVKTCNYEEFKKYVSSIKGGSKPDVILREVKLFIHEFEKDSQSGSIVYLPYYVERTNQNIEKANKLIAEESNQEEQIIEDFVSMINKIEFFYKIRSSPFMTDKEIVELYQEMNISNISSIEAIKFANLQKNHTMAKLIKKIKDKEDIDDSNKYLNYPEYIDAYGFTPLHYAIILGNTDAIQFFLEKISKLKSISLANYDEEIVMLHDYSVLAKYFGKESLSDVLFEKSPEMVTLLRSKAALKIILNIRKAINSISNSNLSNYEAKLRQLDRQGVIPDTEKNQEIRERMQQSRDAINNEKEGIAGLEQDIEELEKEIENCRKRHYENVLKWDEKLKKSSNGYVRYFTNCWINTDKIIEYLQFSTNECIQIEEKNIFFFVPKFLFEQYKKAKENQKQEEKNEKQQQSRNYQRKSYNQERTSQVKKPFGNNWFSPEAHNCVDVLRKEYRILAKTYHPDVNPIYGQVFVEINQERADILEKISKRK